MTDVHTLVSVRRDQFAVAWPFLAVGIGCIIGAGIAAAAIAPAPTEHGVWAVAYLVLVGGIAQIGIGAGQSLLAPDALTPRRTGAQIVGWNAGNAAVLVGTLLDLTAIVDVGGALLVAALALVVYTARREQASDDGSRTAPPRAGSHPLALLGFRALMVILLVSIPIGLTLARVQPG